MPIEKQQIDDLMDSDMYWKENDPLHEDVNNFVKKWFDDNSEKENVFEKTGSGMLETKDSSLSAIKEEEEYIPQKTQAPMSDDEIIKRNMPAITKWERPIEYAYKDTKGNVTTGKGLRSDNRDFYHSLDWQNPETKQKGTYEEVEDDFQSIMASPIGNYVADFYKAFTTLRLSDEEIDKQTIQHLKEDLKQIRDNIKNFDKLPPELQDVIIDLQYNTGHIEKFPRFQKAIQDKNIREMIIQSHRKGISKERNKAMGKKILDISNWDY